MILSLFDSVLCFRFSDCFNDQTEVWLGSGSLRLLSLEDNKLFRILFYRVISNLAGYDWVVCFQFSY